MELLFKREQTGGKASRVSFKLWAKVELAEEEQQLIGRYNFDQSVLYDAIEPQLIRQTALVGFAVFVISFPILSFLSAIVGMRMGWTGTFVLQAVLGLAAGYYYFHKNRETIYVKDLIHGRFFSCSSVCALARKEAGLETIAGYFRQVVETAKHWDGTTRHPLQPLSPELAKRIILSGPVF